MKKLGLIILAFVLVVLMGQAVVATKHSRIISQPSNTSIVYEITGTSGMADVTLANATGGTEQYRVYLPTRIEYETFSGNFAYVSAQIVSPNGAVTVRIYLNGKLAKEASSAGAYTIATASLPSF